MKKIKPKWYTTASVVLVFLFCLVLIVIRWMNTFNPDILVINQEINSHITNFALSILINVYFCFLLLCAGKKYKTNVLIGTCIIGVNFVYEMFLPVLNTVDIIDAVYGTVGVLISLVFLYIVSKYGFEQSF